MNRRKWIGILGAVIITSTVLLTYHTTLSKQLNFRKVVLLSKVTVNTEVKSTSSKIDDKTKSSDLNTSTKKEDKSKTDALKIPVKTESQNKSSDLSTSSKADNFMESKINFYDANNQGNLQSSISFDTTNMKFSVKDFTENFGDGTTPYFKIGLSGSKGNNIIAPTLIYNGATSNLYDLLNDKSFNYGDIISLEYNNNVSIPVVLNKKSVISNIVGNIEYFKITKDGLIRVNLKNQIASKITTNNLNITNMEQIVYYLNDNISSINEKILNKADVISSVANGKASTKIITSAFIKNIGLDNFKKFYYSSSANQSFIAWLLNNNDAMSIWLQGNTNESSVNALQIWSNIWNAYPSSDSGFNLKLAVATALANQTPIKDFNSGKNVGNPVERYDIFKTLNLDGGMYRYFSKLGVRRLEHVVDVPISNNQINKMRTTLLKDNNNDVNSVTLSAIDHINGYSSDKTAKTASYLINTNEGYTPISTLQSVACRIFGQPSYEVNSPSYNTTHMYTDLYVDSERENLELSNKYLWVSSLLSSNNLKDDAINKALELQPLNVQAWIAKINLLNSSNTTTAKDYIILSNNIMNTLRNHPTVVFNLLSRVNQNMKKTLTKQEYNTFIQDFDTFIVLAKESGSSQDLAAKQITNQMIKDNGFVLNTNNSNSSDKNIINDSKTLKSQENKTLVHGTTNTDKIQSTTENHSSNMQLARKNMTAILQNAQTKNIILYTSASVNILSEAVNQGTAMMGNHNATPKEIDNAALKINLALKGLKVDMTKLKIVMKKAEGINLINYTPESVNILSEAVNNGQALLTSSNASLKEVSQTITAITNSINALQSTSNN